LDTDLVALNTIQQNTNERFIQIPSWMIKPAISKKYSIPLFHVVGFAICPPERVEKNTLSVKHYVHLSL